MQTLALGPCAGSTFGKHPQTLSISFSHAVRRPQGPVAEIPRFFISMDARGLRHKSQRTKDANRSACTRTWFNVVLRCHQEVLVRRCHQIIRMITCAWATFSFMRVALPCLSLTWSLRRKREHLQDLGSSMSQTCFCCAATSVAC